MMTSCFRQLGDRGQYQGRVTQRADGRLLQKILYFELTWRNGRKQIPERRTLVLSQVEKKTSFFSYTTNLLFALSSYSFLSWKFKLRILDNFAKNDA